MRKHILFVAALAACSSSTPKAPDAAVDAPAGPAPGSFGATCTVVSNTSTECTSGVCTDSFNQLGIVCSQTCTMLNATDPTCPNGSMGMKCNMKGFCRP